jgi:hypothetical protein
LNGHIPPMRCSRWMRTKQGCSQSPVPGPAVPAGWISQELVIELSAMEKAFDHFEDLGLEGLALMADRQMVAFSIFSPLNHDTWNVQFEKSDFDYKGAAQVINHQTALYLKDRCRYINREQDLGIKGLRQAKMSYEPETLFIPHTPPAFARVRKIPGRGGGYIPVLSRSQNRSYTRMASPTSFWNSPFSTSFRGGKTTGLVLNSSGISQQPCGWPAHIRYIRISSARFPAPG